MKGVALGLVLGLVLTGCKREATSQSLEAEALDWVRIVAIGAGNIHAETGQPVRLSCRDKRLRMKKTSPFLKLDHCTVHYNSDTSYVVTALFNGDIAILSDPTGTRRVEKAALPTLKEKGESP